MTYVPELSPHPALGSGEIPEWVKYPMGRVEEGGKEGPSVSSPSVPQPNKQRT